MLRVSQLKNEHATFGIAEQNIYKNNLFQKILMDVYIGIASVYGIQCDTQMYML